MDNYVLLGLVGAIAPGWAFVWIALYKATMEMFQNADTQALTEKVNPAIVPK